MLHDWPTILTVAGTVGAAVAAALPWVHSGQARRSGFVLVRTLDTLGFTESWTVRVLTIGIALLPALAAGAWTAAALRRTVAVATLGAVSGVVAVLGALAVWRAPVVAGGGVLLGLTAGATSLIGSLALVTGGRRR